MASFLANQSHRRTAPASEGPVAIDRLTSSPTPTVQPVGGIQSEELSEPPTESSTHQMLSVELSSNASFYGSSSESDKDVAVASSGSGNKQAANEEDGENDNAKSGTHSSDSTFNSFTDPPAPYTFFREYQSICTAGENSENSKNDVINIKASTRLLTDYLSPMLYTKPPACELIEKLLTIIAATCEEDGYDYRGSADPNESPFNNLIAVAAKLLATLPKTSGFAQSWRAVCPVRYVSIYDFDDPLEEPWSSGYDIFMTPARNQWSVGFKVVPNGELMILACLAITDDMLRSKLAKTEMLVAGIDNESETWQMLEVRFHNGRESKFWTQGVAKGLWTDVQMEETLRVVRKVAETEDWTGKIEPARGMIEELKLWEEWIEAAMIAKEIEEQGVGDTNKELVAEGSGSEKNNENRTFENRVPGVENAETVAESFETVNRDYSEESKEAEKENENRTIDDHVPRVENTEVVAEVSETAKWNYSDESKEAEKDNEIRAIEDHTPGVENAEAVAESSETVKRGYSDESKEAENTEVTVSGENETKEVFHDATNVEQWHSISGPAAATTATAWLSWDTAEAKKDENGVTVADGKKPENLESDPNQIHESKNNEPNPWSSWDTTEAKINDNGMTVADIKKKLEMWNAVKEGEAFGAPGVTEKDEAHAGFVEPKAVTDDVKASKGEPEVVDHEAKAHDDQVNVKEDESNANKDEVKTEAQADEHTQHQTDHDQHQTDYDFSQEGW